jgi:hypothetical protein
MGIVYPGVPQRLALWLRDHAATRDFVETGTNRAGTARWAARHFDRVVSIEANPELYRTAGKRVASYANVDLRLGQSQDVLKTLIPELSRPALVWLDAHWSGGFTAGEDAECPVLEEIAVVDAGTVQHVVLIDDARYFLNLPPPPHKPEHWPSADDVIERLRAKFDGYICITDDVIMRLPIALRDRFEAFLSQRSQTTLQWVKNTILRPLRAPKNKASA